MTENDRNTLMLVIMSAAVSATFALLAARAWGLM